MQWSELLAKVEGLKGKQVTAAHEEDWAKELGLGAITPWKDQLNEALESYTTGAERRLVDAHGEAKSLDCWRQLADRGDSMRPAHAKVLRTKAFSPPKAVAAKDLEAAIAQWEANIER